MRPQKLVVGMIWMAAACFGAEPRLAVVIYDNAGTPDYILKAAAEMARGAFRTAGVATDWSVCHVSRDPSEQCALPISGTIQVQVLSTGLDRGLQSPEILGYAMCPGC